MALRATDYSAISSSKDWLQFFIIELQLSADTAQGYADEFASQNITGSNIVVGLAEPGFLNQFNISIGHQLELKRKFKSSEHFIAATPKNKVPTPMIQMDVSQAQFDQFHFEWQRYKEHYSITQNVATSLFFCCTEEVRQQVRISQTTNNLLWTEESMMDAIKQIVLSKVSPIVHVKQFLEIKQEGNESIQKFLQRLQAKASCCGFRCRKCHASNTEERVREKFILGLKDTMIQRSALKTESVTPDTPLSQLLTEAVTLEQSTRDQASISTSSGLDGSVFENTLTGDYVNSMRINKSNQKTRCTHCGRNDHTSFERQEKVPRLGKKNLITAVFSIIFKTCV